MSLTKWLADGHLKEHHASASEIHKLFQVIERDLDDAAIEQTSADRRFSTAYNAALQLATIALLASGYRAVPGKGHHYITIMSLTETMGQKAESRAEYLNTCRSLRNRTDYDRAGVTNENQVAELLEEIHFFHQDLIQWLKTHHPDLLVQ
jgi:uncharacterized protein (UPF0332 family)